jgi:hypothetical protein
MSFYHKLVYIREREWKLREGWVGFGHRYVAQLTAQLAAKCQK